MRNLALLLTVSILLLSHALPAEALSLDYNLLLKMNSRHFDQLETPVDGKLGYKAIPQISTITDQPVISASVNNAYKDVNEESLSIWVKEPITTPPSPVFVPEPTSLILFGGGLIVLAGLNRRWINS